jgi:hypothetical protein
MLELPGLAPTPLAAELASHLEVALRQHRRRGSLSRDLFREIEAFLRRHPGASTVEIARGIRARDTDVRAVLNDNPNFQHPHSARPDEGRGTRWALTTSPAEPVPKPGTGSPGGDLTA